jgi:hypothetical protein
VDGVNESSCKVLDGVKEIHRFSVRGYADEEGRDEQAKGMLAAWINQTGYSKAAPTHPAMKASVTVDEKDLPKALEIG